MRGITIAEECHVVNILPPVDVGAGATSCVVVNASKYAHCTFIIQQGVTDNTHVVTVENVATYGGVGVAIGFSYYVEDTALGDVLGPRVTVGAGGFTMTANDNNFVVVEVDTSSMTDGYPYLQLELAAGGAASLVSAVAILSGSRFAAPESPTVLA